MHLKDIHIQSVITGLEGCGKSSTIFEIMSQVSTPETPILFGVKNYKLMAEQIENWCKKYPDLCTKKDFAICGHNKDYEPARKVYTNPIHPNIIDEGVKYVFTSQALIQRNRHFEFVKADGKPITYSYVIIDEFDFTCGIIPTLDYQIRIADSQEKLKSENQLIQWTRKTYTATDANRISALRQIHKEGFIKAYWIELLESYNIPLIFLTSEVLAEELLVAVGFKSYTKRDILKEQDYKENCTINIHSSKLVNHNYMWIMSKHFAWNKLPYDIIISDKIEKLHHEKKIEVEKLEKRVISHVGVRGSNNLRNTNILTVVTHIPRRVISKLTAAINYLLGYSKYTEDIVRALFYRDRICQAVGRVLGYRGSSCTDLIIHSRIYNTIVDNKIELPYNINLDWDFNFEGYDEILEELQLLNKEQTYRNTLKKRKAREILDYGFLDNLFYCQRNVKTSVKDIKQHLINNDITGLNGRGTLPATRVANYFGCYFTNSQGKRWLMGVGIRD